MVDANRTEATQPNHRELTEVSRSLVRLYKERLGHGPTRARAWHVGSDVVVCVMEGTLNTKERTLHAAGDDRGLLETRGTVQEFLKLQMSAVVERGLGRRVRSVVGGIDVEADAATQVFILEPDKSDAAG